MYILYPNAKGLLRDNRSDEQIADARVHVGVITVINISIVINVYVRCFSFRANNK